MFYDASAFPFCAPLEQGWAQVRLEYLGVRDELAEWVEPELYEGSWRVFPLFQFPHGERIEANASRCPFTASLVERHFGRHGAAGFSVLGPGTTIRPHQGYQGRYLRCHLGLEVPTGDCRLSVRGEIRAWRTGRLTVFDDRESHEAWNRTGEERVVLLVDFEPAAPAPAGA